MKLKKALVSIILLGIFITGCNQSNTKESFYTEDEETQQRMMTKVQNDVNEIMNKDYEYVLKNMGEPYCTTYYIDIENKNTVDLFDNTDNVRLIYPKYTAEDELEGSALYIELQNNKVIEVQTYEFTEDDIKTEIISDAIDIIVDKYSKTSYIPLTKVENIDFSKYEGSDYDSLYKIVGDTLVNVEVYDKNRKQYILAYALIDDKGQIDKILTVLGNEEIIGKIEIVNKEEVMNLAQQYLYKY